uniref:Uncharacterized protein n=1 Tax=Ananas comosus var. bracteatus TaxID=296719 RepID=A0A6V7Q0V0_ANACO|nr:unnamed protein product [Ananas comosus var. bracteatus]
MAAEAAEAAEWIHSAATEEERKGGEEAADEAPAATAAATAGRMRRQELEVCAGGVLHEGVPYRHPSCRGGGRGILWRSDDVAEADVALLGVAPPELESVVTAVGRGEAKRPRHCVVVAAAHAAEPRRFPVPCV